MIPKIIHYCWFGRGEKPDLALRCIESWRKYCPDYEFIEWNEDTFDVTKKQICQRSLREQKICLCDRLCQIVCDVYIRRYIYGY